MTKKLWVFPAILSLLCVLTFTEVFPIVGFTLFILWFIRIYCLKNRSIFCFSILLIFGLLFRLYTHQEKNQSLLNEENNSFVLYPEVTSIKVDGDQLRFNGIVETEVGNEGVVIHYVLKDEKEKNSWLNQPSQMYLKIKGKLQSSSTPVNFYQFNYKEYLQRENIHWILKAEKIQGLNRLPSKKNLKAFVENIRYRTFRYIDSVFSPKIASYLKILLFADKRQFSKEILQSYQALGIIHLFSISGFHISFLIHFIRRLLLRLGITHEFTNGFLILLLPLYGLVAGMGVSVFRAVMQQMIQLLSRLMNKPVDTIDAWALTMIVAIFIQPTQIYLISFQLSYLLSGIFILMGQNKWTQELHSFQYSLLFSLLSSLASLPILAYHFFEFSWISLFANILFIPFFSSVLFPSILFLFMISFVLSETTLFFLLEQVLLNMIYIVEGLIRLLSDTFEFSFITGRITGFLLVGLVFSLFLIIKQIERKQFPRIIHLLSASFCLFFNRFSPIGQITMLDVGQGDAILIKAPYGQGVTLIDTGGRHPWEKKEEWMKKDAEFSVGKDVIVPSLKALGVSEIDQLYLTHADNDHSGEVLNIGKVLSIKEITATENTLLDQSVKHQILQLKGTNLKIIHPPEKLEFPNKDFLAVYPIKVSQKVSNNNQSLVLYGTIGEDKWLFTGDVEREAEQELLKEYAHLTVDYLKVSHHGSQTSTTKEFIEQIRPSYALISAGRNNSFGHPHQDVLDTLEQHQVDTYVTSERGAISVRYLYLPIRKKWVSEIRTVH